MQRRVRAALADRESGLGMILVIGISVLVFTIAASAAAIAVNGISQSRQRTAFEVTLAAAEAGVDRALAEVQVAYSTLGADYPIPGPVSVAEPAPWCQGTPVSFPTSGQGAGGVWTGPDAEDLERQWARAQLEALVAGGSCIQSDGDHEYVVLKPVSPNAKYGKVYALSAMPSFADADETRLIKSEYVFMPFRPAHAILSAGPLSISSSTTVTAASGVDPSLAAVHSNATITGTGNPTVYGQVTSTGSSTFSSNKFYANPTNQVETSPAVAVPRINATSFYAQAALNDPGAVLDWYDLCTDGTVRPYSTSGVPCSSSTVIGTATSMTVRGWEYTPSQRLWTSTKNALPGTYFAHEANVDVGTGNATFSRFTVVASAENPTTCGTKRYGNITWDHYDLASPAYHNLFLMADSDVVTTSNFSAGSGISSPPVVSGMFVAGDQMQMETSSQGAVGSVVIANQCPTPAGSGGLITTSEVKNPAVYFDPNADAPFASVITTALWLDYSGG
ncbi:hypothetical protein GCM10010972_03450 [Cellulomonas carbonis]|uniref:Type 4 fimbrial biogenesis protein PilX N-terminal domain-containing protein n=2 Tax=Cellulomonas carbonis TaxID=1386092 RepID=A0A0A0BR63_9CELL|nr:hypothetical protein N868_16625 [Cellulomonas carbonis T26]GGB94078.1 hypothetical protein GCM10010972_03450 [Cellulomonas carbonis]